MVIDLAYHAHLHVESSSGSAWGTFPQWITMAIGLVAAVIAVRTYRSNAWQTKVKVARLVYCDVYDGVNVTQGTQPEPGFRTPREGTPLGIADVFEPDTVNDYGQEVDGLAKYDAIGFYVVVHNNSDEPVGECCLQVLRPSSTDAVNPDHPTWIMTMPPATKAQFWLWVRRDWPPGLSAESTVRLSFSDSAGQRWERTETNPPTMFEGTFGQAPEPLLQRLRSRFRR